MLNILQQEDNLKNLDTVIYETAEEIGRLNSIKMKLEKEVEDRMKKIAHYNAVMIKKCQETF